MKELSIKRITTDNFLLFIQLSKLYRISKGEYSNNNFMKNCIEQNMVYAGKLKKFELGEFEDINNTSCCDTCAYIGGGYLVGIDNGNLCNRTEVCNRMNNVLRGLK